MIGSIGEVALQLSELTDRIRGTHPNFGQTYLFGPAALGAVDRLVDFAGRALPAALVEVLTEVSLGSTDLGVFFPGPDYADGVIEATISVLGAGRSFLVVAIGEPFYCLLDLETGVVSAVWTGEAAPDGFSLNCDFRQFVIGLGTVRAAQLGIDAWGDSDAATQVRASVARDLDSPLEFWRRLI